MLLTGAAIFVMALFWSAVLDPAIRLLHALQSLIYVAVVVLARRNSPWGFGAGCFKSGFWNSVNLFVTGFVKDGLQELALLVPAVEDGAFGANCRGIALPCLSVAPETGGSAA